MDLNFLKLFSVSLLFPARQLALVTPCLLMLAFAGCGRGEAPQQNAVQAIAAAERELEEQAAAAARPASRSDEEQAATQVASKEKPKTQSLLTARKGFTTELIPSSYEADDEAPVPPASANLRLVQYRSPAGKLAAYVSPDPEDGERHPAVLWAHGGFGGIGSWFWEEASPQDDQTASAFREAGIVMMLPSWRGENDNDGSFELFFGEIDDLLAAREYLAGLPYVDPERIYLAGHSTGGTLALLAATASHQFRAVFSFGGAPDMEVVLANGGYGNTPFDPESKQEVRLRSAIHFVNAIESPTFYFEGEASNYCRDARRMEAKGKRAGAPFTACIIEGADHFNILAPLTKFLAKEILADRDEVCQISITNERANQVYQQATRDYLKRRAIAVAELPIIDLTPAALNQVEAIIESQSLDPATTFLMADLTDGGWNIEFIDADDFDSDTQQKRQQGKLTIVVPQRSVPRTRGYQIDFVDQGGQAGFVFLDQYEE